MKIKLPKEVYRAFRSVRDEFIKGKVGFDLENIKKTIEDPAEAKSQLDRIEKKLDNLLGLLLIAAEEEGEEE